LQYSKQNLTYIHSKLIAWYRTNKRNLPWRQTTNPYKIWLSEIILQQTRVAQGLSYYLKFIENYPSVNDLAYATEDEILKDWQGLGYYSRARNLHAAAKEIVKNYKGKFPNNYEDIKKLKGVGDYTAAAIISFAYKGQYPVVDGNVYRFLSRLFGITTPIDTSQGKKDFYQLAKQLLGNHDSSIFNQAIMEFGALQCSPKNPDCSTCPLQSKCSAFETNSVENLPVKQGKTKVRKRHFTYLIIEDDNHLLINKRNKKDIWQGLYDFPSIETTNTLKKNKLSKVEEMINLFNQCDYKIKSLSEVRKHLLSHQQIFAQFCHIDTVKLSNLNTSQFEIVKRSNLHSYPIPKLLENYLREETNLLSLPQ
tara:strand:+ start:2119 stop:3213 length:1095 start_codon:yes stop_codon:yes gene_type:complete